jgi:hypothetical protein
MWGFSLFELAIELLGTRAAPGKTLTSSSDSQYQILEYRYSSDMVREINTFL